MRPLLASLTLFAIACASQSSAPNGDPSGSGEPAPERPPRRPGAGPGGGGPGQRELEDAIAHAKADDLDGTMASCRAAIAKNPNLEQAYLLLGSSCSLKDDDNCERAAYEQGLKALPKSAALHKELGFLELRQGHATEAVTAYESARSLSAEKDPEGLADLAYAYALANRLDDAEKTAGEAVALSKSCFHCAMMQGEVRLAKKSFADAATSFQAAIKLDEKSPDAKLNLAKAYFLAGRYADARPLYDTLIAAEPDNVRYRVQAAQVATAEKRYGDAVQQLKAIAEANPGESKLLEMLLEAQEKAGDKKGAAETKKKLAAQRGKK